MLLVRRLRLVLVAVMLAAAFSLPAAEPVEATHSCSVYASAPIKSGNGVNGLGWISCGQTALTSVQLRFQTIDRGTGDWYTYATYTSSLYSTDWLSFSKTTWCEGSNFYRVVATGRQTHNGHTFTKAVASSAKYITC